MLIFDNKMSNKEGNLRAIFGVMIVATLIALFWESIPTIKNFAHLILNPTAGLLLSWNLAGGMTLIVLVIALITTLSQKYGTDQKAIREMKKQQKEVQEEMKKIRDNPEKLMAMQKEHFSEFMPKMMKLSMRPVIYTMVPLILFFRWFADFFAAAGDPRILGLTWFWFYLIGSIIFSSILRKVLKVA